MMNISMAIVLTTHVLLFSLYLTGHLNSVVIRVLQISLLLQIGTMMNIRDRENLEINYTPSKFLYIFKKSNFKT